MIILELVTIVVKNVGVNECGRLKAHADCKIVSDLITLDRIKVNRFALDGGVIISKIMQIEKERKIEFEHVHVRTKSYNAESGHSYEKKLMLECDNIAKEVRLKCNNEVLNNNIQFRGNVSLNHKGRCYDRKISEIIKKLDSSKNLGEYLQDEHGKQWWLIAVEAREGFTKSTKNKIKCASGINVHRERIKMIDKGNMHAVCPE